MSAGPTAGQVLLHIRNLRRELSDRVVIQDISFELAAGDILFVKGPSGAGKTLLLRALACLDKAQAGTLTLSGKSPSELGFPQWRAQVTYVPQSRVNYKGTPAEFYYQAQQFAAQKGRARGDLPSLIHELGLEQSTLNQAWSELSGGQAQRVSLAIAVALRPAVLLLDEPTSACDLLNAQRVESVLRTCGSALVWVTHDSEQPLRVGGRMLELPMGTTSLLPPPPHLNLGVNFGGNSKVLSDSQLEPELALQTLSISASKLNSSGRTTAADVDLYVDTAERRSSHEDTSDGSRGANSHADAGRSIPHPVPGEAIHNGGRGADAELLILSTTSEDLNNGHSQLDSSHQSASSHHMASPVLLPDIMPSEGGGGGASLASADVLSGAVLGDDSGSTGASPVELGASHLLAACLLTAVLVGLSIYFSLGLHWFIGVAAVRCVLQLTVLGYLLLGVINYDAVWLVLLVGGAMAVVASMEAVSRPSHTYKGMLRDTLAAVSAGAGSMLLYTLLVLIRSPPLLQAQYAIPLLGVLLGNTLGGVSVGLSTVLEELAAGRGQVEAMLALGATRMEATQHIVQRSLRVSLSPILSQLSVVGLLSVPSLMAGQLLQGADVVQASRYQVCIMFLIAGASAIGAATSVLLAVLQLTDKDHCFLAEELRPRYHGSGIVVYLRSRGAQVWGRVQHAAQRFYASCCGRRRSPWTSTDYRRQLTDSSLASSVDGSVRGSVPMGPPEPADVRPSLSRLLNDPSAAPNLSRPSPSTRPSIPRSSGWAGKLGLGGGVSGGGGSGGIGGSFATVNLSSSSQARWRSPFAAVAGAYTRLSTGASNRRSSDAGQGGYYSYLSNWLASTGNPTSGLASPGSDSEVEAGLPGGATPVGNRSNGAVGRTSAGRNINYSSLPTQGGGGGSNPHSYGNGQGTASRALSTEDFDDAESLSSAYLDADQWAEAQSESQGSFHSAAGGPGSLRGGSSGSGPYGSSSLHGSASLHGGGLHGGVSGGSLTGQGLQGLASARGPYQPQAQPRNVPSGRKRP